MAGCGNGAGCGFAVLTIFRVAETGSTNADMLAMATRGDACEGDWLIAECQTAGRGRMGRTWDSPQGNFHGSTLVRLQPSDPPAASLGFAFAVAVREVVNRYAPQSAIKWPNDVLIGRAKVAGLLLERRCSWVVAGIGINVTTSPPTADRPTAKIVDFAGSADLANFSSEIAAACHGAVARWRNSLAATLADWQAAAHPNGTLLTLHLPDGGRIEGHFDGLGPDGALRLRLPDGAVRVIHAGDVFLI